VFRGKAAQRRKTRSAKFDQTAARTIVEAKPICGSVFVAFIFWYPQMPSDVPFQQTSMVADAAVA